METANKPTHGATANHSAQGHLQQAPRPTYGSGDTDVPRYNQRVLGSFVTCILAMATSGSGSFTPSVLIGTTWQVTAPVTLLVFFVASIVTAVEIGKYYWKKFVRQVDDVVLRVSSSPTLTRIKSSMSASSMCITHFANRTMHKQDNAATQQRSLVLSASETFLSVEDLAKLSLTDVRDVVRYASDMNRLDFNKGDFFATSSENARIVATALSKAMAESRGTKVAMSIQPIGGTTKVDDMDALGFLAMTRLFAEWRSVRLVPTGYKRYAMGMGLAKRDLVQNIQKMETAVHSYLSYKEQSSSAAVDYANGRQISSPTIKQLLLWETEQQIHAHLPKLNDKSGALGMLWIQRQLQYQASTFQNLLSVPLVFPTAKEAVAAAYIATYEPYHGFIVKQMFQHSFEAAPDVAVILRHMDGGRAPQDAASDAPTVLSVIDEAMDESNTNVALTGPIPDIVIVDEGPLDRLANHVSNEWVKLQKFLNQCKGHVIDQDQSKNALVTIPNQTRKESTLQKETEQPRKVAPMGETSEEEIPSFVAVFQPMLDGLDGLLESLNMKDPSKC